MSMDQLFTVRWISMAMSFSDLLSLYYCDNGVPHTCITCSPFTFEGKNAEVTIVWINQTHFRRDFPLTFEVYSKPIDMKFEMVSI